MPASEDGRGDLTVARWLILAWDRIVPAVVLGLSFYAFIGIQTHLERAVRAACVRDITHYETTANAMRTLAADPALSLETRRTLAKANILFRRLKPGGC